MVRGRLVVLGLGLLVSCHERERAPEHARAPTPSAVESAATAPSTAAVVTSASPAAAPVDVPHGPSSPELRISSGVAWARRAGVEPAQITPTHGGNPNLNRLGDELRALAITGEARSPLLPDVPTLAESGFPGLSAYVWSGLVAPKGTPRPIIDELNRQLREAVRSPAIQSFVAKQSVEAITDTPDEFKAFISSENSRWGNVIKAAGVTVN